MALVFVCFSSKMGCLFVDCGREAYIPMQILKGEVLYKDIFNIYAPLSYLLNAFLFKVFGENLQVLYLAGFITFGLILTIFYKLLTLFCSKYNSLIVVICILLLTSVSPNVFNFFLPYSYGMIYGLVSVLASLYFLLRNQSNKDLYLASFFAGVAILNKYEFLPYLLPFSYCVFIRLKSYSKLALAFGSFFLPILLIFAVLINQGLNFDDIYKEYLILTEIMKSQTMMYFYSITGVTFSWQHIPLFLFTLFPFLALLFFKIKNSSKISLLFFIFFAILYALYWLYKIFVFLPLIILILFVVRYKKLSKNTKILVFSYFAISLKVFFSLMLFSYGTYFIGISLIVFSVLLPILYRKAFIKLLSIISITYFVLSLFYLSTQSYSLKLERIKLNNSSFYASSFKQVYDYLKENSSENDVVLAFPEEPMLNFALNRNGDSYLYSLIPMYVEVFGEEHIITRLRNTNADFVVVSNFDTGSYGYRRFGNDYAVNIMNYIENSYTQVFETKKGLKQRIYRRKD